MQQDVLFHLSEEIRNRRETLDLTQEEFAKMCEIHRTYLSDIERGCRNISLKTLLQISRGLKVSASELLSAAESRASSAEPINSGAGTEQAVLCN